MPSTRSPRLPAYSGLEEAFKGQLRTFGKNYKIAQLITGGLLPVVEGVLINRVTSADELAKQPLWIVLGVLVVIHVLLLVVTLTVDRPLSEFLIEFDKLKETLEEKERELAVAQAGIDRYEDYTNSFRLAIDSIKASVLEMENARQATPIPKRDVFAKVLKPWITVHKEIFWYKLDSDKCHMGVYLVGRDGYLSKEYCFHDERIKPANRLWRVGQGHPGICASQGMTLFSENLGDDKHRDLFQLNRPEDVQYYKSAITTPIMVNGALAGVFTLTSSRPEQFTKELHGSIVEAIGYLLSQACTYCLTL